MVHKRKLPSIINSDNKGILTFFLEINEKTISFLGSGTLGLMDTYSRTPQVHILDTAMVEFWVLGSTYAELLMPPRHAVVPQHVFQNQRLAHNGPPSRHGLCK